MKRIIYSYLLIPALIIISHGIAIFNSRIRTAVLKRYGVYRKLKQWKKTADAQKRTILIHASSMGEFEHIKPLITKLNEKFELNIIVTFFSPSAFEVVKKYQGVNQFIYHPFDLPGSWKKIYTLLHPSLIIISKHDVWPNQIWVAEKMGIPTFLVNASLSEHSGRSGWFARLLLRDVYLSLTQIFTISKEDLERFDRIYAGVRARSIGDTKFDQVTIRKEQAQNTHTLPLGWDSESTVIILGSVWPEDLQIMYPVLNAVLKENEEIKLIIVPHQPNERFLDQITNGFSEFETALFTRMEAVEKSRIILVDIVGILADLYRYADIAYVGGSFKQGIHNVMEPAVYGIPVMYGPAYENSFEAIQLYNDGGSRIVSDHLEFDSVIRSLLSDDEARIQIGRKARTYAAKNIGATDKIIDNFRDILTDS